MKKIAVLATIPSRESIAQKTIDSIYNQVDNIIIHFNGYTNFPIWIDKYSRGIFYIYETDNYAGNVVWFNLPKNSYIFIIDDDIIYPNNYVNILTNELKEHGDMAVVCVHAIYAFIHKNNIHRKLYHFSDKLLENTVVNITGVGTCMFNSNIINPTISGFEHKYFRDIQFSIYAKKCKIPIISIKRQQGWLIPIATNGDEIATIVKNTLQDKKDELTIKLINE